MNRSNLRSAYVDGGPLVIPKGSPTTIASAFLRTVETRGDCGITFADADAGGSFLSYIELFGRAQRALAGLRALGLRPGARIILQNPNLSDHFAVFWGAVLGGIVPVTVAVASSYEEPNAIVQKVFNTWKLLDEPKIITSAPLVERIAGAGRLFGDRPWRVFPVEELLAHEPTTQFHLSAPEEVVFLQLTSGSTGIPKCIQETSRGIISHIHASQQFNGYSAEDVTLNWLPFDHVVPILTFHLKDTYLGCRQVQLKTELVLAEPLLWLDALEKHRATHSWSPNFGFKLVNDRLKTAAGRRWDLSGVKFLMNAGEQVTLPVVSEFLELTAPFGIKSHVMQPAFGMAEACTCMTYQNHFEVRSGVHYFSKKSLSSRLEIVEPDSPGAAHFIDLGPPAPGVQIRITDSNNQLVEEGRIGRFQIRGDVITPGYLHNKEANAEAFVGDGWFNSGDLGFILDGRLTLTGREKEMIIIRGANFYCYEIEAVASQSPGVTPTFVAAAGVQDPQTGTEGLIIFYVPQNPDRAEWAATIRDIKSRVARELGMNPLHVVPIDKGAFPKTTSGKIQRGSLKKQFEAGEFDALLAELRPTRRGAAAEPQSERESTLLEIWREVLGEDGARLDVPFFEVGDSLRAFQVASRIRARLQAAFAVEWLFDPCATIRHLARKIETAEESAGGMAKGVSGVRGQRPIERIAAPERLGPLPVSSGQQRIWLLEQLEPGTGKYHVPMAIDLEGVLDQAALEKAIAQLIARHEILRSVYALENGKLTQRVLEAGGVKLGCEKARGLAGQMGAAENKGQEGRKGQGRKGPKGLNAPDESDEVQEAMGAFDLARGPVVRFRLFERGPTRHTLVVTVHQIAIDGWSQNLIVRELAESYRALVEGGQANVPVLPVQMADYAAWEREQAEAADWEKQIAYWQGQIGTSQFSDGQNALGGPASELASLKTDATAGKEAGTPRVGISAASPALKWRQPARSSQILDGETWTTVVPMGIVRRIKELARSENASLFMALLAAYGVLLRTFAGARIVPVGTAVGGRPQLETEGLIGFFVNTVVLRIEPDESLTFRGLVGKVRRTVLEAAANKDVPFDKLVAALGLGWGAAPLFQVWFALNDPLPSLSTGGLNWKTRKVLLPVTQFELTVFASETEAGLRTDFEYSTAHLDAGEAAAMAKNWQRLLEVVAGEPDRPVAELMKSAQPPKARQPENGDSEQSGVGQAADSSSHERFKTFIGRRQRSEHKRDWSV